MQTNAKHIMVWIIVGALFGIMLTSWIAPKMIIWYFTPPVEYGINCSAPITWALTRLRNVQMIGLGIGAVLGLVARVFFGRRRAVSTRLNSPSI